jgi:hypothetical protein
LSAYVVLDHFLDLLVEFKNYSPLVGIFVQRVFEPFSIIADWQANSEKSAHEKYTFLLMRLAKVGSILVPL